MTNSGSARRRKQLPLAAGLFFYLSGCASHPPLPQTQSEAQTQSETLLPYPPVDASLGEKLYPNEEQLAQQLAQVLERAVRERDQAGPLQRDAHPKAHGCVRAEFHIHDSLPPALAQGIFRPGTRYDAWIRFSNGNPDPTRADSKGDARGMAIKVLGVPGAKLLEPEHLADTQDFVMINHPVFFLNDPADYLAFSEQASSDRLLDSLKLPFTLGFKGLGIVFDITGKPIANPLHARYWSAVPFQLGVGAQRQAVKFSAKPCAASTATAPQQPAPDYLRQAMQNTLTSDDACMEFLVQPRTSNAMSLEDSMTEWEETEAPFHPVAQVHIPRQTFTSPEQDAFCESLSFTPWHSLPEHRPLGAINRLRKVVYEHISRVRNAVRDVPRQEP